jgi:uncharacterized protein (TIGR00251 family)
MFSSDDVRQSIAISGNGSILSVEVSAGNKEDRFPAGYNPWRQAVGIQVKACAVENKANKAVIALIAKTLEIPKTAIRIISGQTSSGKKIMLNQVDPDFLAEFLFHHLNNTR